MGSSSKEQFDLYTPSSAQTNTDNDLIDGKQKLVLEMTMPVRREMWDPTRFDLENCSPTQSNKITRSSHLFSKFKCMVIKNINMSTMLTPNHSSLTRGSRIH